MAKVHIITFLISCEYVPVNWDDSSRRHEMWSRDYGVSIDCDSGASDLTLGVPYVSWVKRGGGGGEKTPPCTAALGISPSNYRVKLSPTGLRIDYQAVGPAVCCSKQIEKIYQVSLMNRVWHMAVRETFWTPRRGADSHFSWPPPLIPH